MSRPILATVYPDALRHNLALARAHAPQSKVLAVIKANGYGHGMLRVAHALSNSDGFAVLEIEEGIALRDAGFKQRILLLEGFFTMNEVKLAAKYQLATVIHNEEQLLMLEKSKLSQALDIFIKLNTGMNRLGLPLARFWSVYDRLKTCKMVNEMTLMTHFACADDERGVSEQLARFNNIAAEINKPKTLANSAAVLRYPETHADWIRPGIMLYGATPLADQCVAQIGLQAAMQLSSKLIAVQHLDVGDSVGYGLSFTADKPMPVGIVACGYADGYPGQAPTGTPIMVAGQHTRTLGRVSMDMLCVDLSGIPQAVIGSPVELWGTHIPVDTVAKAAGTIGYELLCSVAPRVTMLERQGADATKN